MSNVSGEVASSREMPGSAGAAVFVTFGCGFVVFGLGFTGSRLGTRLSRTEAGGGWDTTRVPTDAAGGVTAAGGGVVGGGGGC